MEERQARLLGILAIVVIAMAAMVVAWDESPEGDEKATEKVWDLSYAAATSLRIEAGDQSVFLKKGDRGWDVREPFEGRADPDRVHRALTALTRITTAQPMGEVDPKDFGLNPPKVKIKVTTGSGADQTLVLGDEAQVGSLTYALSSGGEVVAIPGRPSSDLLMDPLRWQDPRMLSFTPGDVVDIALKGPQGTLHAAKTGDRWFIEGWSRVDLDALDELYNSLQDLRFNERISVTGDPGPAIYQATLTLADGAKLALMAGESDDKGLPVWTSDGQRGWVVTETAAFLGQGPRDLGEKEVVPFDFEHDDAVTLRLGGKQGTFTRKAGPWVNAAGQEVQASAIESLDALWFAYQLEPVPPISEDYGEITVKRGDRTTTVKVGQRIGDQRVVQDAAGGSPMFAPAPELEALAGKFGI